MPVSARLTRLVISLNFTRRPVFIRLDRYVGDQKIYFLNPKVSRELGDVLPDNAIFALKP